MSDRITKRRIIGISALGAVLIGLSAFKFMPIKLVWNASISVPKGLYYITYEPPKRGDLVLVQLPEWAKIVASQRQYLSANVPAIKRVSALSGDCVCRFGRTVFVNGIAKNTARLTDAAFRKMPSWHRCLTLTEDQILLLSDHPNSFDGRYFGVTRTTDITGLAHPIWTDVN